MARAHLDGLSVAVVGMSRETRREWRRWEATRQDVLRRAGHRCEACGKAGRLEVDHVIPIDHLHSTEEALIWDMANLQALCRECHLEKTRRDSGMDARHAADLRLWEQFRAESRRRLRRNTRQGDLAR